VQGAAGVGDRALGVAQRVARLARIRLTAFKVAAQRPDPCAQRGKILLSCRRRRCRQKGEKREE
jgi:hypothetical protein